jgi:pimeloyl-ACP methyl ester carboxylesterase
MEPTFVEGEGGVPIATWDLGGPPESPTLLVAHATGFHSRCYRALAGSLADRFRIVAIDLRGHGRSGTPPLGADGGGRVAAMGWDRFAGDALAVVDTLGVERPVGFGHSCGGAVLLLAEERRPGTFAAIYTYEPVVGPPEMWVRMAARGDRAAATRRRRPVFASRAAALEHLSSKPPLSSMRGDVLVDYVEGGFVERPDGAVGLRCDPEAEAATYAMAVHADTWEHLPEVGCQVTVACGGARADFGCDVAAAVAGRLPQARVEEHSGLGHLGPFEQPEVIAEAVAAAVTA